MLVQRSSSSKTRSTRSSARSFDVPGLLRASHGRSVTDGTSCACDAPQVFCMIKYASGIYGFFSVTFLCSFLYVPNQAFFCQPYKPYVHKTQMTIPPV